MEKVTREQSKSHNKTLILNTIYSSQPVSRADISRITSLTRSTVSDIVAELIDDGLVCEAGFGQSAGGKPPVLLNLVDDARQIIGVDLASSEFRGVLINLRGEVQERFQIPIDEKSGDQALEVVYQLVEHLISQASKPVLGIGIGAPGLMDSENGIVRTAVNLDWRDLPLVELLEEKFGLPVYIANDSQVSVMAEYKFGEGEKSPNMIVVKIGRGVGSGVLINHQLFQGDAFGAGEIGHVKVEENGIQCRCGNYGCLETKISSRAIRNFAREAAKNNPESLLHKFSENDVITMESVQAAYQAGDPEISAYINEAGTLLGQTLSVMTSILNINKIVLAGSVSGFQDGIIAPALETMQGSMLPGLTQQIEMTSTSLGDDIVNLGAAGLVLHHELGIL